MELEKIRNDLLSDIKKLRSKEGYLNAGYPNFDTLFGRDSLISAWQLLPIDPTIAYHTLRALALHQAEDFDDFKDSEPGKILHVLHERKFSIEDPRELSQLGYPYYGSIDSTSLFLIVLSEYTKKMHDTSLAKELWPQARKALGWHLGNAKNNAFGFITYESRNPYGTMHQGWKDSSEDHLKIAPPVAIVEEQGYAYKAYRAFSGLAERLKLKGDEIYVEQALKNAAKIKENFRKLFYLDSERYFALGLGVKNKARAAITSNPGHLLICDDFLNDSDKEMVADRLFKEDMWSTGGIRTLSLNDPDYNPISYHLGSIWPHDNWMIYTGLVHSGFEEEAGKIKNSLIRAYNTLGHIPELYTVTKIKGVDEITDIPHDENVDFHANLLQAWSVGALLNVLADQ